jgi:hypothetical protein
MSDGTSEIQNAPEILMVVFSPVPNVVKLFNLGTKLEFRTCGRCDTSNDPSIQGFLSTMIA